MLKSLQIKNFTAFSEAALEFCDGLNVVLGENGVGKSHVLKLAYAVMGTLAEPRVEARRTKAMLQRAIGEKLVKRDAAGDPRASRAPPAGPPAIRGDADARQGADARLLQFRYTDEVRGGAGRLSDKAGPTRPRLPADTRATERLLPATRVRAPPCLQRVRRDDLPVLRPCPASRDQEMREGNLVFT